MRLVISKGGLLIGFQQWSSYVAPMDECRILPPEVPAWCRACIAGLSVLDRIPQIEIAVGEASSAAFRHLLPFPAPTSAWRPLRGGGVQVWGQPNGPGFGRRLFPAEAPGLAYTPPGACVSMAFGLRPISLQVNMGINRP